MFHEFYEFILFCIVIVVLLLGLTAFIIYKKKKPGQMQDREEEDIPPRRFTLAELEANSDRYFWSVETGKVFVVSDDSSVTEVGYFDPNETLCQAKTAPAPASVADPTAGGPSFTRCGIGLYIKEADGSVRPVCRLDAGMPMPCGLDIEASVMHGQRLVLIIGEVEWLRDALSLAGLKADGSPFHAGINIAADGRISLSIGNVTLHTGKIN